MHFLFQREITLKYKRKERDKSERQEGGVKVVWSVVDYADLRGLVVPFHSP